VLKLAPRGRPESDGVRGYRATRTIRQAQGGTAYDETLMIGCADRWAGAPDRRR
jgi:hypothetical protein